MICLKKKIFCLTIFFTIFIFIEILSYVGSKFKIFLFNNPPYFYSDNEYQNLEIYWTEKERWGAWHNKNLKVKHKKECFNVYYETNEIGARDESFVNIKDKKNIVLIGDSFAEGYGLNKSQMFETIIEKETNFNVLNFGTSKDFGILQYLIIYENLAKFYDHDIIIITLLPNNDFKDNDYLYYKKNNLENFNSAKRYRPYYIKSENNFKIYYPKNYKKTESNIELILKKYFWVSNPLRTIQYLFISRKIQKDKTINQITNNKNYNNKKENITAYYSIPIYQQEAGIFFLKNFIKNTKKKIYLFSIPLYDDQVQIKKNDIRKNIYWWKNLKLLDTKNKNFKFFDLYDYSINQNYKSYFFPQICDGHWNFEGNKWAGHTISNLITAYE